MDCRFPQLETGRLILRPLAAGDLNFVFRHFSDPEVNRYLFDEPPVKTIQQAQEIVDFYQHEGNRSSNRWVLVRKSDGLALGTCGYHQWNKAHHRAEIGYDLGPEAWNQGYMTGVLTAALGVGLSDMSLNRIAALVYPGNQASVRLLEKSGFTRDGTLRGYYRKDGIVFDHWMYSLLKTEWGR